MMVEYYTNAPGPFCQKAEDGDYLAHLNTPNVARDMDLIRNLTGFVTIDYFGNDYGAIIGAAYAALFPNHVGRFVFGGTLS